MKCPSCEKDSISRFYTWTVGYLFTSPCKECGTQLKAKLNYWAYFLYMLIYGFIAILYLGNVINLYVFTAVIAGLLVFDYFTMFWFKHWYIKDAGSLKAGRGGILTHVFMLGTPLLLFLIMIIAAVNNVNSEYITGILFYGIPGLLLIFVMPVIWIIYLILNFRELPKIMKITYGVGSVIVAAPPVAFIVVIIRIIIAGRV